MASIDAVFRLLKYRTSKSGYSGTVSSSDFNLIFPDCELRYFLKLFGNQNEYQYGSPIPRIVYPETLKISSSLAQFGTDPTPITIDNTGKYTKPDDIFFIDSISHVVAGGTLPTSIERVEKQDLNDRLYSYYQPPTELFPIYVEYKEYIQFYPITLGTATITYLRKPTTSVWGYTLNGGVATTNTLVSGTGYTNGTYPNVNITGGAGNSAVATITVAGGVVSAVQITTPGFGYKVGDTLSATVAGGTGFSFKVASISNAREVYDPTSSTDPEWADYDISEIIYLAMQDLGLNLRDTQSIQMGMQESKTGGI